MCDTKNTSANFSYLHITSTRTFCSLVCTYTPLKTFAHMCKQAHMQIYIVIRVERNYLCSEKSSVFTEQASLGSVIKTLHYFFCCRMVGLAET